MILFYNDWANHPNAIIDLDTPNKSFVRLAGIYKAMGIRNNAFPLALLNPALKGIDPHRKDLSLEQIMMIAEECKLNPWYFFREVIRIPAPGSPEPVRYIASRANIAMYWLFFNHITSFIVQIRQTGKSVAADCLNIYLIDVATTNTDIHLLTRNDDLRVKNIKRIKEIESYLPSYLSLKSRADANNTEKITCTRLGNTYLTAVGQASIQGARNVGRGMTIAIHHVDELAYIANIDIILPALLASAGAARQSAEKAGGFYGTLFTSTPGFLSSRSGRFAHKIYQNCFRWTEKLLDCYDREDAIAFIKKNSPKGDIQVLCEFNHRQLGYTDEWLRTRIAESLSEGENALADYLNIWPQGSSGSPIRKDLLERIVNSAIGDPYTTISKYGYLLRWYVTEEEVNNKLSNRKIVIGLDTSEAIGNDDICMVMLDVETGEVVGTGQFNETNVILFSEWLAEMLIEFPNTILMPERRSSGGAILDNLLLILEAKGIDPFRRIFNWIVNDADVNQEYSDFLNKPAAFRSQDQVNKYRKHIGYATSGAGRAARDNLYGASFTSFCKYHCDVVRDKTLIGQLSGLVTKNGRIDHEEGEHDDMVISAMLGQYFLTKAKNISYYGLSPRKVLMFLRTNEDGTKATPETIIKKTEQSDVRNKIEELINKLRNTNNIYVSKQITQEIRRLYNLIDDEAKINFNIETLLEEIELNKKRPKIRTNYF